MEDDVFEAQETDSLRCTKVWSELRTWLTCEAKLYRSALGGVEASSFYRQSLVWYDSLGQKRCG